MAGVATAESGASSNLRRLQKLNALFDGISSIKKVLHVFCMFEGKGYNELRFPEDATLID